jgi:hypothetical protein
MKVFQFLSYVVLWISQATQKAKKTSNIPSFKRGAQTPNGHFSLENIPKRGPLACCDRAFNNRLFHPRLPKGFPDPIRVAV